MDREYIRGQVQEALGACTTEGIVSGNRGQIPSTLRHFLDLDAHSGSMQRKIGEYGPILPLSQ